MAARTEELQLKIALITDEAQTYAKLINANEKLVKDLKSGKLEGDKLTEAVRQLATAAKGVEATDLSRIAPTQLQSRLRQLKSALDLIADKTSEDYKILASEFQKVDAQIKANTRALKGLNDEIADIPKKGSGLSTFFQNAFAVFAGGGLLQIVQSVGSFLFGIGTAAVKATADLESLEVTITTLTGSAKTAREFLADLQKFAAETPFEFPDIAEAGKNLLAYGYSADEAKKFLARLGDVASVAKVPITELASIVGKAKLGQLIQGEELNQLADRGINVFSELAEVLGTTEKNIKKLGSEGKISYQDLEKAIVIATDKGGQFFEQTKKQANTFNGILSTLTDNFSAFAQVVFGSGVADNLKNIFKPLSDFIAGVTDALKSGTSATGEYADVVNAVVIVINSLKNAFSIVFEVVKLFFEGAIVPLILGYSKLIVATEKARDTFFDFAENLKKIPILGALFAPLLAAISLVRDLTQNASATFAGFRAAAEQAVQNVKNYFNDLVLTAQIAAVRIQKALAISDSAEAFYQKQIDGLNAQKTALATSGKTVAEAYTIARNNALLNGTIKNQEEENQRRKKKENNDTELDAKAEKAAETARKKAFDAKLKGIEADSARLQVFLEKDRLEGIINETEYQTTLAQIKREEYSDQLDAIKAFYGAESLEFQKKSLELQKLNKDEKKAILEIELKAIEQAGVDKKQFAESEFLQNLSTEKEYQRQLLVIDIQTQEQRLARLRTFSDAQTSDVITAENKILKAKSDIKKLDDQANKQLFDDAFLELSDRIDGEIDLLEEGYETEERLLNQKFVTAMLTEQDYEIQKLEAKKALVEAEIAILEGGGEKELKTVKAKNKELLKIDDEIAKKTVENEKRTQAAKRKLLGEGAAAAEGFFSLAVDLLGRDEAARKKNANTIKAFQKAEVITKGIVEVAKIFESYSTIPFAGPVIAAVNAGLAVGRTVVAVNRINQTQFAEGGYTGDGFWRDATGYRVAGVVHEGEWVAPKWMVENPNYAPLFQNLEQKRYKGFAEGGFVTQSTAPVGATTLFQNTPQNTQNQSFYTDFLSAIALLRQDVQNVKGNLKAVIFRNEYEAQAKADANDRSKATI